MSPRGKLMEIRKILSKSAEANPLRAMAQNPQRYPIGTQTFSILREEGYLYVDKTDLMCRMTHSDSRYIFLSRTRRFWKPLLLTTLKSYFEYVPAAEEGGKAKAVAKPGSSMMGYTTLDLGIAKYNFEVGTGVENFDWA